MRRPIALRHDGFDVPVFVGAIVIGRAFDCQIVLQSGRVSRRHAVVMRTASGLTVQDLGSANGVYVNGVKIRARTPLVAGDQITIGDELLSVVDGTGNGREDLRMTLSETMPGDDAARRARTEALARMPSKSTVRIVGGPSATPRTEATTKENAIGLIASVADKLLARGNGRDAERILRPRLTELLVKAREGEAVPRDVAEVAAREAVKLAAALQDASWAEYAFDLYAAVRRPLPSDIIDSLHEVLRNVPPIRLDLVRRYVRVLDEAEAPTPGERFLIQRIRGLAGLAAAR